jgi:hypothetical protein
MTEACDRVIEIRLGREITILRLFYVMNFVVRRFPCLLLGLLPLLQHDWRLNRRSENIHLNGLLQDFVDGFMVELISLLADLGLDSLNII